MTYRPTRTVMICSGLTLAILLCVSFYFLRPQESVVTATSCRLADEIFIIDPGHGGEDGGAVSLSGHLESQLNLEIGQRLDLLFGFYGVDAVMTRTEDLSLHDASADTIRKKKVSDLKNRVKFINGLENATLVSIHQNSFPQKSSHGLQVFYGNEVNSKALADRIQSTVAENLDSSNHRQATKIPSSIYLMGHITCRAVLVECGFLSNPTEDHLLQDNAYQIKLAMSIATACLKEGETPRGVIT